MENLDKNTSSKENELQPPERKYWRLIYEEPAFISILSAENPSDIDWYEKVDKSPEVQKWMIEDGEAMTKEDIKHIIASHPKKWLLYAVSGEKSGGELEGWIQMWSEEEEKDKIIKNQFPADFSEDDLIIELSYARYKDPNLPEEKREKGLISSGIRQICYLLGLQLTKEDAETKESKKPLLKPKLSFVAYTNPLNKPSERVLEKSGFKNIGKIKYEPSSEKEDNFWVLDWDKLADFYAKKDEERMKMASDRDRFDKLTVNRSGQDSEKSRIYLKKLGSQPR